MDIFESDDIKEALTWQDLQDRAKKDMLDYGFKQILEDGDDVELVIHQVADGCLPLYVADLLFITVTNQGLVYRQDGLDYDEDSDAADIILLNIYTELCEYLNEGFDELLAEYENKDTESSRAGGTVH